MKKWKILEEEDVSPSRWFPVVRHTVELANGTIIDDYYFSPMGNVAMVLPVTTDNKFVLVKQYKHAIGDITIELPAGSQQKGKTVIETAVSELEEEVGIKTAVSNLIPLGKFSNNPTKTTHITYSYLARDLEFNSQQNLDITEEIEVLTVTPQDALTMIINGDIWAVDSVATIMKAYLRFPELFENAGHDNTMPAQ